MKSQYFPIVSAIIIGLSSGVMPLAAHAEKTPKSVVTDKRLKQVTYDPMEVYTVSGRDFTSTTIAFDPSEVIQTVTIGDSIAWQVITDVDRLYVKPVEDNATTNLSVRTDKRTYYFELRPARSNNDITYLVQFRYPDSESVAYKNTDGSLLSSKNFDPANLNLDYEVSGKEELFGLKRVFDDGQFTYFLFEDGADIPAFYRVLPDGTESLVNTRREGNYMVVERVDSRYTLRNGKIHLCVSNGAKPYKHFWFQTGEAEPKKGGVKR